MEQERYSLYVSVLGKFSIRLGGMETADVSNGELSGTTPLRQHSFLQYLCVFHDREVSQEELIDAVCDGDTGTGDPVNTLKTTLYRTRQLLETLGFPDGKRLLRYRRGYYSWAPELDITLDAEVFDGLYDEFYAAATPAEGLDAGLRALRLYQGEFLSNSVNSLWTVSLRTYYHGKYMKLARDTAEILYQQGRLEEGIELCRATTTADPFDEENQLLMMKLLQAAGLTQAAIQHYEKIRSLFMDQLGVTLSEELSNFYRKLTRSDEPRELDLGNIRDQLLENDPVDGAYFCEYSVFQNMYRFIARSTVRTGQAIQLAMTVLYDRNGEPLPAKRCTEPMDVLHDAIHRALRTGDIFTRYSRDQYLVMLPSSSYENAAMALERVLAAYERTLSGMTTQVQYSILPVLPPKAAEADFGGFVLNRTPAQV